MLRDATGCSSSPCSSPGRGGPRTPVTSSAGARELEMGRKTNGGLRRISSTSKLSPSFGGAGALVTSTLGGSDPQIRRCRPRCSALEIVLVSGSRRALWRVRGKLRATSAAVRSQGVGVVLHVRLHVVGDPRHPCRLAPRGIRFTRLRADELFYGLVLLKRSSANLGSGVSGGRCGLTTSLNQASC